MRQFILSVLMIALTGAAAGDGISVRKWLTFDEVVRRSGIILSVEVVSVHHRTATRRAYGEDRRYVVRYRFRVRVEELLRGWARAGARQFARGRVIMIERYGNSLPGKWLILKEWYREGVDLCSMKKGDRFIAYGIRNAGSGYSFDFADSPGKRKAIRNMVRRMDARR